MCNRSRPQASDQAFAANLRDGPNSDALDVTLRKAVKIQKFMMLAHHKFLGSVDGFVVSAGSAACFHFGISSHQKPARPR